MLTLAAAKGQGGLEVKNWDNEPTVDRDALIALYRSRKDQKASPRAVFIIWAAAILFGLMVTEVAKPLGCGVIVQLFRAPESCMDARIRWPWKRMATEPPTIFR